MLILITLSAWIILDIGKFVINSYWYIYGRIQSYGVLFLTYIIGGQEAVSFIKSDTCGVVLF